MASDRELEVLFSERFKSALEASGLTLTEMALRTGASRQMLYHWTQAKAMPQARMMPRICKELNVSSDWLLGLKEKRDGA